MLRLIASFLFTLLASSPVYAFTENTGLFDGTELIGDTNLDGPDGAPLALCYQTREFNFFGVTVQSDVTAYGLSSDGCATIRRSLTTKQMEAAQSFDFINPRLPTEAANSFQRDVANGSVWVLIGAAMVWIVFRRTKSLLGYDTRRPMRNKAGDRILGVMCYVGSCDGLVDTQEIAIIIQTAQRLTRQNYKAAHVIYISDQVDLNMSLQDFVDFGKGLRDSEKDTMMRAAFYVALASGHMLPIEHQFLKNLAIGIGMPGEDFRRVMNQAFSDLDRYPPATA